MSDAYLRKLLKVQKEISRAYEDGKLCSDPQQVTEVPRKYLRRRKRVRVTKRRETFLETLEKQEAIFQKRLRASKRAYIRRLERFSDAALVRNRGRFHRIIGRDTGPTRWQNDRWAEDRWRETMESRGLGIDRAGALISADSDDLGGVEHRYRLMAEIAYPKEVAKLYRRAIYHGFGRGIAEWILPPKRSPLEQVRHCMRQYYRNTQKNYRHRFKAEDIYEAWNAGREYHILGW